MSNSTPHTLPGAFPDDQTAEDVQPSSADASQNVTQHMSELNIHSASPPITQSSIQGIEPATDEQEREYNNPVGPFRTFGSLDYEKLVSFERNHLTLRQGHLSMIKNSQPMYKYIKANIKLFVNKITSESSIHLSASREILDHLKKMAENYNSDMTALYDLDAMSLPQSQSDLRQRIWDKLVRFCKDDLEGLEKEVEYWENNNKTINVDLQSEAFEWVGKADYETSIPGRVAANKKSVELKTKRMVGLKADK